jgi:RimJ/RimL family protein N-acetyltransferase
MELETSRLRLRRWRPEDRPAFYAINCEPAVNRYLTPLTREGSDARIDRAEAHFEAHGWGNWAVEEKAGGALIGLCGLMHVPFEAAFTPAVEAAWRFSTPWQGRGFAREAAEAVIACGFDRIGLDRIVAFTVPANTASWGLMIRLGMARTGAFDHPTLPDGHPLKPHLLYEIRRRGP